MHPKLLRLLPAPLRARLEGNSQALAVLQNTAWLLLDQSLRLVLNIVVGARVARYLGPALYGQIAYVTSYILFFSAISPLGTNALVVRDIAREPLQAGTIVGTAFRLRLASGIAMWIAAALSVAVFHPSERILIWMTVIQGTSL